MEYDYSPYSFFDIPLHLLFYIDESDDEPPDIPDIEPPDISDIHELDGVVRNWLPRNMMNQTKY